MAKSTPRSSSHMKRLILLTPLFALLFTASPCKAFELWGLRVGDTPARAIARQNAVKGKNVQGQCLPYALNLVEKLRAAGISAHVLGYCYGETTGGARDWGNMRGHAVVVYQDGGRTYLMDNQSWMPRWVEQANDNHHLAVQFEGMNSQIVTAWQVKEGKNLARTKTAQNRHQALGSDIHSSTNKEVGTKFPG